MRSLSNLIKSGKVVDIGTPVNVGLSYTINESNRIMFEKAKGADGANRVKLSQLSAKSGGIAGNRRLTQEEIMAEYIEEAEIKANSEYESVLAKAREEGILKAKAEADRIISNANTEYNKVLEEINQLKEQASNEYKASIKDNEKEIIDFAFHIAEKIINYEVDKSDNYILGIVQDAVEKVLTKKDVVVRLSTQDYYTIQANKKLLVSKVKGFGEIDLVQDEALDIGSCIVDTPLGVIDGSLQVRMDNIQKEVNKLLTE